MVVVVGACVHGSGALTLTIYRDWPSAISYERMRARQFRRLLDLSSHRFSRTRL